MYIAEEVTTAEHAHTNDRQGGALRCPLMLNPRQGTLLPRLVLRLQRPSMHKTCICFLQHVATKLLSRIATVIGAETHDSFGYVNKASCY